MEALNLNNLKVFRGKLVDFRRKSPTANGSVMFNDMLGTTQGTVKDGKYSATSSTLFGETSDKSVMFTGKPMIDGLGYSFLFRSYLPELAKWTPNFDRNFEFVRSVSEAEQTKTADPLGYPDGFNNFAYVNNGVTSKLDPLGLCVWRSKVDENKYIPVPFSEKNAEKNTPEGYSFDPCDYNDVTQETSYTPVVYFKDEVILLCGDKDILSSVPKHSGDDNYYSPFNEDPFESLLTHSCSDSGASVHGYTKYTISATAELHPIERQYDCLRNEDIGYVFPNTAFPLNLYSIEIVTEIKICE